MATDQGVIALVDDLLAPQGLMQVTQHAALLGDHQQTGGIAIETMHQFDILGIGAQLAKHLDDPGAHAAAAMHGDPGGLVEHDQRLILVDDRRLHPLQQPLRQGRRLIALGQAQRWHAHLVSGLKPIVGLDPPLVHAHLSLTQDAIDQGLGRTLETGDKEIVDTLTSQFRRHIEQLDTGGRRGGSSHPYIITIFHSIEALNHCCYSREAAISGLACG